MRKLKPTKPLDFDDNYDKNCDQKGEYYFYAGLKDYNKNKADSCINIILTNSAPPDYENSYLIDFSKDEQET